MHLKTFLWVYFLGGITFIPLTVFAVLLFSYLYLPRVSAQTPDNSLIESSKASVSGGPDTPPEDSGGEENESGNDAAGYFAVCREYVAGGVNGKPPERSSPAGEVLSSESPSVYQSMYRSIFERNKTQQPSLDSEKKDAKPVKRIRNVFFVVLRHKHLMLFDNADQLEVRHVISLLHHDVDVYGGGEKLSEGDMWIKKNCIRLTRRTAPGQTEPTSQPFYIFSDNCSEKEDFYHALLLAQAKGRNVGGPPLPRYINTDDAIKLVQALHRSDADVHCRWINAMIGRIFLGMYKTQEIEDAVKAKITRKISRVSKPNFISSIQVNSVRMGDSAPVLSNPKLRELMVDGSLTIETDIRYNGGARLEIAAVARIELGSRIRAREVDLVLAGVLRRLSGHLLIRIKPPPSNRLWFTFETPPQMDFAVEPVVSSMQITYGVILRAIESRIKEVIVETLVLPNWDDMPFFSTEDSTVRGGIWDVPRREAKDDLPKDTVSETIDLNTADSRDTTSDVLAEQSESEDEPEGLSSKNARMMSMPNLIDVPNKLSVARKGRRKPVSIAEGTAVSSAISTDLGSSGMGSQQAPKSPRAMAADKPKMMRSNSFAAAATPVISKEDVSPTAARSPTLKGKKHLDVVELFKEVKLRSDSIPILKHDLEPLDKPATEDSGSDRGSQRVRRKPTPPESESEVAPAHLGIKSSQTLPVGDTGKKRGSWNLVNTPPMTSAVERATLAAKNWGINMMNKQNVPARKNVSGFTSLAKEAGLEEPSKSQEELTEAPGEADSIADTDRTGQRTGDRPSQPMGRGQPLPPVGTPLPGPKQSLWASSSLNLGSFKRKPVASPPSIIPAGDASPPAAEYAQQRRRTSSTDKSVTGGDSLGTSAMRTSSSRNNQRRRSTLESLNDQHEDLLVVAAPADDDDAPTRLPSRPPTSSRASSDTKLEHDLTARRRARSFQSVHNGSGEDTTLPGTPEVEQEESLSGTTTVNKETSVAESAATETGTIDTATGDAPPPEDHHREAVQIKPGGGWHTGPVVSGNEPRAV